MSETWTIKKLLDWTQNYFQQKAIESARLDAELLLSFVLKLERMQLYLQFDRPLSKEELKTYKTLIKRRVEFEPVAYILEEKEFYSRNFKVTPNVLIPRPDTEVLIEKTLEKLSLTNNPTLGLEIGSGSGCIAVTLLCESPHLKMVAFEKSQAALEITVQNAKRHHVLERLDYRCKDFLEHNSISLETQLDFMVSNPPYISEEDFKKLDKGITAFEPHLALKGGNDGLNFYPALAQFGKINIKPNGFLAIEIGDEQGQAVQSLLQKTGYQNIQIHKDYADKDRVVLAHI